jgi:hypothetical protein
MRHDDDYPDDWANPDPSDDDELKELVADIGSVLAAATAVPAAIAWWRTRRERRSLRSSTEPL